MSEEYDARMGVFQSQIRVGRRVLVKLEKKCKTTPHWDPQPFVVTEIKGSMVTATRDGRTLTRNSSMFKLFFSEEDDEPVFEEPTVPSPAPQGEGEGVEPDADELAIVDQPIELVIVDQAPIAAAAPTQPAKRGPGRPRKGTPPVQLAPEDPARRSARDKAPVNYKV